MVREYIEFSKLETEYYINDKRTKNDVLELIAYCIKNNILKQYMLEHKKEVANLIENLFSEERRIQRLINNTIYEKQQELEKAQNVNKTNQEEIERLKARIKELEDN